MKVIFRHNEDDEWTQLEVDDEVILENHRIYTEDILEWLLQKGVITELIYTDKILE